MADIPSYQRAQKAGAVALLKQIAIPSILVTHSQGAPTVWLAADECPHLVKAIIAVEPNGPAFAGVHPHNGSRARMWGVTDIPIEFSPPISDPSQLHLMTIPATEVGRHPTVLQDEKSGHPVHKFKICSTFPFSWKLARLAIMLHTTIVLSRA